MVSILQVPRILFTGLLIFVLSFVGSSKSNAATILLIHSYHEELVWVKDINQGLNSELSGKHDLHFHYMDTKRIARSAFPDAAHSALQAYQTLKPKLVILCDDNALNLVGKEIAENTPVIFCGINNDIRQKYPALANNPNITGVLERPLIVRTIIQMNNALDLQARKVMVILGSSPTAHAYFSSDLKGKETIRVSPTLNINIKRQSQFEGWQTEILSSKTQGYDFILAGGFYSMRDQFDRLISVEEINQWLGANSPLPVFTIHRESIGPGMAIGGMVVSGEFMGRDVGKLAQQVLNSKRLPRLIPFVTQSHADFFFSASGLTKWNLNLSPDFPRDSEVLP